MAEKEVEVKLAQATEILEALGFPKQAQNPKSAPTLLALVRVRPTDDWNKARQESVTVTKGVMDWLGETYGILSAPNTREDYRRRVLHRFLVGNIADKNPDNPSLPTNSPLSHYAVTTEALEVIRTYGTDSFDELARKFRASHKTIADVYAKRRDAHMVPLRLPDGREFKLSPGKHNELAVRVIDEFGPRFAPGALVVYLGDTANKTRHVEQEILASLGVPVDQHGKLPDVVLYDAEQEWLFLIEIVTSHGPVSAERLVQLEELFSDCTAGLIHISAFPDLKEFKKNVTQIAWDTEVWIADMPDHMIHFNGDRFLGPRD